MLNFLFYVKIMKCILFIILLNRSNNGNNIEIECNNELACRLMYGVYAPIDVMNNKIVGDCVGEDGSE